MTAKNWLRNILACVIVSVGTALPAPVQGQDVPQREAETRAQQQIQGEVRDLDSFRRLLTLEDGTQLAVPRTVLLPGGIVEGTTVKASFRDRGGQNVVTALEVQKPVWGQQTVEDIP